MTAVAESPSRWSQGITGPALTIAATDTRRLHVAAGPGTGKTTAIMRRIARLLDEGVDPRRILMVTFTRAAASDLTKALEELEVAGCDKIDVGTLHSFCFKVLMRSDVLALTGRVPRPLMDFEKRVMIEDVKTPGRGVRDCTKLAKAFEAGWARLQSDEPGWPHDPAEQAFQRDIIAWLRYHQGMLMEEVINETRNYLRQNPLCPERQAYDHVIVDEYQDLNRADQDVIDLLAMNGTLTVVGDEDQAIYSRMRFAQPESMSDFPTRHDGTESMSLDTCRRCPKRVVKMANHLIANNTLRVERQLEIDPDREDGEVEILQWPSMEAEAEGLAAIIQEHVVERNVSLGDILVLVPRRTHAYAIRDALGKREIVAHTFFYEEALNSELARERFTLLSLFVNPEDRVSLRYWLGHGSREYRTGTYRALREHCAEHDLELAEVLEQARTGVTQVRRIGPLVARMNALEAAKAELVDLTDEELIDAVFPEHDDLRMIRRAALDALHLSEDTMDAAALLEEVRTRIIYPEPPPTDNYVRIMSLHKSKGLAARLVVVAACVQGWIPSLSEGLPSADAHRELEEQRRLFYVAITRARETLVLSSFTSAPFKVAKGQSLPFTTRIAGGNVRTMASQFLSELGSAAPMPQAGISRL